MRVLFNESIHYYCNDIFIDYYLYNYFVNFTNNYVSFSSKSKNETILYFQYFLFSARKKN